MNSNEGLRATKSHGHLAEKSMVFPQQCSCPGSLSIFQLEKHRHTIKKWLYQIMEPKKTEIRLSTHVFG